MNFYKRHLGDYLKKTKGLSILEHGVYTLLLDEAYATEKPLPKDLNVIYRILGATSKRERNAVVCVLSRYFQTKPTGFINKRVQEEIKEAKSRIKAARNNGQLGGRPSRNTKPTGLLLGSNPVNSQTPEPDSRGGNGKIALPLGFALSDELVEFCRVQHVDASARFAAFIHWVKADNKMFVDWNAAFRSFIMSGPKKSSSFRREKKSASQKTKEAAARVLARHRSD